MGQTRRNGGRAGTERRILECWLPLAAEANELYEWHLAPAALERLVRRCAPALFESSTAAEARAVLFGRYNAGFHL